MCTPCEPPGESSKGSEKTPETPGVQAQHGALGKARDFPVAIPYRGFGRDPTKSPALDAASKQRCLPKRALSRALPTINTWHRDNLLVLIRTGVRRQRSIQ